MAPLQGERTLDVQTRAPRRHCIEPGCPRNDSIIEFEQLRRMLGKAGADERRLIEKELRKPRKVSRPPMLAQMRTSVATASRRTRGIQYSKRSGAGWFASPHERCCATISV